MQLSENAAMLESLRDHARRHKAIYGECGGLMYLSRSIDDFESSRHEMVGLLPARVRMTRKRVALGYVTAEASRDTFLCRRGEHFRGHEFHYSTLDDAGHAEFAFELRKASGPDVKSDGIVVDRVLACYAHAHFASCPALAARLVAVSCGE
jgi:cobyrinic acid a,c-diamide synthase